LQEVAHPKPEAQRPDFPKAEHSPLPTQRKGDAHHPQSTKSKKLKHQVPQAHTSPHTPSLNTLPTLIPPPAKYTISMVKPEGWGGGDNGSRLLAPCDAPGEVASGVLAVRLAHFGLAREELKHMELFVRRQSNLSRELCWHLVSATMLAVIMVGHGVGGHDGRANRARDRLPAGREMVRGERKVVANNSNTWSTC